MHNIEIIEFFFDGFKKEIESIENKVRIVFILLHHHHNFLCAVQEGIKFIFRYTNNRAKGEKVWNYVDWKVKNSKNRQYDNTNFDDKRDVTPLHFV
jgi:hypothetical protein